MTERVALLPTAGWLTMSKPTFTAQRGFWHCRVGAAIEGAPSSTTGAPPSPLQSAAEP